DVSGLHTLCAGNEDDLYAVDLAYRHGMRAWGRIAHVRPLLTVEEREAGVGQGEEHALLRDRAEGDVDGAAVGVGEAVPRLRAVARCEHALGGRREIPRLV